MKKGQLILICLTAAFICILLGIYIGRNDNHIILITGRKNTVTTIPQSNRKLDINTATSTQLQQLPGIGDTIAQNIIDYREQNGPFIIIDDLLKVDGIGNGRLEDLLEYIYISS